MTTPTKVAQPSVRWGTGSDGCIGACVRCGGRGTLEIAGPERSYVVCERDAEAVADIVWMGRERTEVAA